MVLRNTGAVPLGLGCAPGSVLVPDEFPLPPLDLLGISSPQIPPNSVRNRLSFGIPPLLDWDPNRDAELWTWILRSERMGVSASAPQRRTPDGTLRLNQ